MTFKNRFEQNHQVQNPELDKIWNGQNPELAIIPKGQNQELGKIQNRKNLELNKIQDGQNLELSKSITDKTYMDKILLGKISNWQDFVDFKNSIFLNFVR